VLEATWGESSPFSIGIEEEVMILDAGTYLLSPAVELLVRETEPLDLPGEIKTELFAAVVELTAPVSRTVADAVESVAALRRGAATAAERNGLRIAAAGTHPISPPEEQEIANDPRYLEFVEYAGVSARRQGVNGLHVHVGMQSADACFHALEGVLPWLPLVLALSANSPYLAGRETGLASNRAEILAQLPRSGSPPAFRRYSDWEAFVERLVRLGLMDGYRRLWWDIRPHPQFGTLEVRMPDQPTRLAQTAALTALLQALCVVVLAGAPTAFDPAGRGIYQQNRWAALRRGPRAELVHPFRERLVPVPELAAELVDLVAPAAAELGTSELLEPLLGGGCEGDEQLEIGRDRGLEAVCADLVARTAQAFPRVDRSVQTDRGQSPQS
jgi:glutamate---cysteine ligase / carboxylate-amine ligase